ncbi:DUF4837 family protein [Flavobacterium salilacus subsp. salilacus]|uniref:DUF4837 family protein n=1 Tax=Flavobacterium TaxID=237 RepID=UPI0010757CF9|nr:MULTISPECIES: DUF4837 family protein [Flavobacterium]KAF2519030.1 DUF4837 family protein [Flavobacterium salilacus subsp. salilacus]MBE1614806.1 DUF4837 family protein [Flavobacterium sp. SaA2.13]
MMKRMKQIVFFVFVLCTAACKNDNDGEATASKGNINEISIIINDALWSGDVGDSLRKKLAAPVDGLTQEEPLFTLNQYHESTFGEALKKGRNIIIIDKGGKKEYTSQKNSFCAPQNIFTFSGETIDDLLDLIEMHSDEIIRKIKETEIAENQKRNKKAGLLDTIRFKQQFDISIMVPATYAYAIENKSFVWLKKDIPSGNTNILLYSVPYDRIEHDKTILSNIISMRDSIGNMYIHGQEEGMYMKTEEAYSPYLFMTSFKDKRAFETRGNWEMENDFMNGPFLNYAIRDDKHECYLVIEGFIYSPSSPKRDLIIELESIIKSLQFR